MDVSSPRLVAVMARALLVSSWVSVTPMVGQCGCRTYRWSASSAMSMVGAASGAGLGAGGLWAVVGAGGRLSC